MTSVAKAQRICIIGAGASGVIAARELKVAGVEDFVVFEIQEGPGGLYKRDNYANSCHTTNMCFTSYACCPPKDVSQCDHYTLGGYVQYLEAFVEQSDLRRHIYYGTRVVKAAPMPDGRWELRIQEGEGPEETFTFEKVICASGTHTNHDDPKRHPWLEGFEGDIYHSSEFRNSSVFENKRVIICGGGESASDVTIHTAKAASQTWIAMRSRTGHITPRGPHLPETDHDSAPRVENHRTDPDHYPPDAGFDLDLTMALFSTSDVVNPAQLYKDVVAMCTKDFMPGMKINVYNKSFVTNQFGCKNCGFSSAIARYGCIPKPPIKSCAARVVTFEDGTTAEDVDAIILCIGYRNDIVFFEDDLKCKILNPRNSFKHCVHPEVDNLYLVGFVRPAFGNIPQLAEMQSRWVAQLLSGRATLPPREAMITKIEADREFEENQFVSAKRLKALTSFYHFAMDMADLTDSHPNYGRLFFDDPVLFAKILLGQFTGYIFHLKQAKTPEEYARTRETIMNMPLANPWHIDLALFMSSFHLFLVFGGFASDAFKLKGTTPFHRMSTGVRLFLAAVLLLNPVYLLFVFLPMTYITLLCLAFINTNTVRIASNIDFLRGINRPSYYVAKSNWDWLHKRTARVQFFAFILLTMPYDLFMTVFVQKHLVNQSHVPTKKFFERQMNYKSYYSEHIIFA